MMRSVASTFVSRYGAACASLVLLMASPARGQTPWVPTMIATGYGGAYAINDHGQVVGGLSDGAFSWTPSGGRIDLPSLGGTVSQARGVNNAGAVVGYSQVAGIGAPTQAFLWTAAGGMVNLGPALGATSSRAHDINNAGQIVGYRQTPSGSGAFLLNPGGQVINLGTLGTLGGFSEAMSVNDAGQVVGQVGYTTGPSRAFLWTSAGGMVDLGTLGGGATALTISNAGQVVGGYGSGGGGGRAFSWTAAGGMIPLGTLGGLPYETLAFGVNDIGEVVGYSGGRAFFWTATHGMVDIGDGAAHAINHAGQVAGRSIAFISGLMAPGVRSAPRQDVTLDFGAQGVWALKSLTVWEQIHSASPEALAANARAGNGAMVSGDLDGNGLDDLVVDFGAPYGVWVWMNHATWVQLHGLSPTRMVTGNLDGDINNRDEVVFDFPGYGLWRWNNNTSWMPLHNLSATHLATGNLDDAGGEELVVDFPGAGLWVYGVGSGWAPLHASDATTIAIADLDGNGQDDLVATFTGVGLFAYRNNAAWTLLHTFAPIDLGAGDLDGNGKDDLLVNFGGTYGLWVYGNDAAWGLLNKFSPDGFVVGDLDGGGQADVAIDFSTHGVWVYRNNATWHRVHTLNPETMTLGRLH